MGQSVDRMRKEAIVVPEEWAGQSSHWGAFEARAADDGGVRTRPHPGDPTPTDIVTNVESAARHRARIRRPAVRRSWLENGPGPGERGVDEFVEVDESDVVELLAGELERVYAAHGPTGVYGGSYGWASAGRFHHAQSQVHRFLNTLGGYVRSVNTYSLGASEVTIPHVLGRGLTIGQLASPWSVITEQTDLVVSFGGMPLKNVAVTPGGISTHTVRGYVERFLDRGGELVMVSPQRHSYPETSGARWVPIVPGTDVAVMLAMVHTLLEQGLVDTDLVGRLSVGFAEFEDYVLQGRGGASFDAEWAASVSGVPAEEIRSLAGALVRRRAMVNVSWSLQRARYGEQAVWAGIALATAAGTIGLPGQGFGHGYGSMAEVGAERLGNAVPRFPQGRNGIDLAIPVARVSDLLLGPGDVLEYNGQKITLPDIKLVYWAGGNPFHHHQDLARLRRALARPDTVVVNETFWTATARHADIVLPATMTIERDDIGASRVDPTIIAMKQVVEPFEGARDDYAWFSDLADACGVGQSFTEGRSPRQWLAHMWEDWRHSDEHIRASTPSFEEFWDRGEVTVPAKPDATSPLERFRADPDGHPLATPSGRIEITSQVVRSFGYSDAPGHPVWFPPDHLDPAILAETPLCLLADQPSRRLHSQLDMGEHSMAGKRDGREPVSLHPDDAAARGIRDGDIVEIRNSRGACLAVAQLTSDLRPGVAQLSTGAWYDPEDLASGKERCLHGNPNVLTSDVGTSRLAQGCTGARVMVEIRPIREAVPRVRAYEGPTTTSTARAS